MVAQDSPLPESGESWATTLSGSRESWATTLQSQNFSHERKKHTRAIRKKLLLIKVNPKKKFFVCRKLSSERPLIFIFCGDYKFIDFKFLSKMPLNHISLRHCPHDSQ